jgi:hypothetical protein
VKNNNKPTATRHTHDSLPAFARQPDRMEFALFSGGSATTHDSQETPLPAADQHTQSYTTRDG